MSNRKEVVHKYNQSEARKKARLRYKQSGKAALAQRKWYATEAGQRWKERESKKRKLRRAYQKNPDDFIPCPIINDCSECFGVGYKFKC